MSYLKVKLCEKSDCSKYQPLKITNCYISAIFEIRTKQKIFSNPCIKVKVLKKILLNL